MACACRGSTCFTAARKRSGNWNIEPGLTSTDYVTPSTGFAAQGIFDDGPRDCVTLLWDLDLLAHHARRLLARGAARRRAYADVSAEHPLAASRCGHTSP